MRARTRRPLYLNARVPLVLSATGVACCLRLSAGDGAAISHAVQPRPPTTYGNRGRKIGGRSSDCSMVSRDGGSAPGPRARTQEGACVCRHGLIDIRLRPLPAVITNRRPVVRRRSWTLGATIGRGTLSCGRIVDRYGDYLFTSESVSDG